MKAVKVLTNPVQTYYKALSKFSPETLFAKYADKCRKAGITKPQFILSFDCDTKEDINVVWDMHQRLMDMGVQSVYAVPGELLQKGEDVYGKILESGSEFINHGYREHTYFDQAAGQDLSCFFYDQQPLDDLVEDISKGHQNLKDVLGVTAQGWRTPHFGTFQKNHELRFLHKVLNDLGYKYSSSTKPYFGYRFGPLFNNYGLCEIPVSGMVSAPLAILDSWAFFMAPDRTRKEEEYLVEINALTSAVKSQGAGLINLYADPLHIYDKDTFFQAIESLVQSVQPLQFKDLKV